MADHKNLHDALRAVQSEVGTLPKDATNPHFRSKFTPLDTIVERVGPLLAEHGLTWQTFPCFGPDGAPALRYKLTHTGSGDCESEVMPLLVTKADPQGMGSAITYARRYSICAVLNLVADEDDDGNGASRHQQNPASARPTAQAAQPTERPASAKQRGMLNAKAAELDLCPVDYANLLLAANGSEPRDFDSQEHAEAWLKRALDRFPASKVNALLEQFARVANDKTVA